MGEVFRAQDDRLERQVAIKTFPAARLGDAAARQRFRKEARLLSQLNHPNVASVYDFESRDDLDFLVMELIPGSTLANRLLEGALSERDVRSLALQMVDGLAAAHDHGIAHGDLKPANVIITPDMLTPACRRFAARTQPPCAFSGVPSKAATAPIASSTPIRYSSTCVPPASSAKSAASARTARPASCATAKRGSIKRRLPIDKRQGVLLFC